MKIDGITVNKTITLNRVVEAVKRHNTTLDNPGFCLFCGEDADGVEGDARGYICEICDEPGVYGAEELLIVMA